MKKHYRHENECLNCGTTLEGKFCHNCGQENLEIKESFGHTMVHAIGDYFHFDEKFFHTLKPLLFRPGYLTIDYLSGKRVQYLHPVRMYIFISLVYFLLLFKTGPELQNTGQQKKVNTEKSTKKNQKSASTGLKDSVTDKTLSFGHVKVNAGIEEQNKNSYFNYKADDSTYEEYLSKQKKLPADKRDGLLMRALNQKFISYNKKYGERAKDVFIEEVNHNIPKMMFFVLPVFALILKFAFWKNHKFYIEHLIFTFHLHCFLFLFLAIMILAQMVLPFSREIIDWIEFGAAIYILWYFYRSLRVMYGRNRFRTFTKIIGLIITYSLTLIASLIVFIVSVFVLAT